MAREAAAGTPLERFPAGGILGQLTPHGGQALGHDTLENLDRPSGAFDLALELGAAQKVEEVVVVGEVAEKVLAESRGEGLLGSHSAALVVVDGRLQLDVDLRVARRRRRSVRLATPRANSSLRHTLRSAGVMTALESPVEETKKA